MVLTMAPAQPIDDAADAVTAPSNLRRDQARAGKPGETVEERGPGGPSLTFVLPSRPPGMSDFEFQREINLARNRARMQALGLDTHVQDMRWGMPSLCVIRLMLCLARRAKLSARR